MPDDKTQFRRHAGVSVTGTAGELPTKHTHRVDISGSGTHDIVMEQAKSECDSMTLKTAVKKVIFLLSTVLTQTLFCINNNFSFIH